MASIIDWIIPSYILKNFIMKLVKLWIASFFNLNGMGIIFIMSWFCFGFNQNIISFSDDENEDGEPDLHQCGHCKLMFNNLTKYITHKLQKVCYNDSTNPSQPPIWPDDPAFQNGASPSENSGKEEGDNSPQSQVSRDHGNCFNHKILLYSKIRKLLVPNQWCLN